MIVLYFQLQLGAALHFCQPEAKVGIDDSSYAVLSHGGMLPNVAYVVCF